MRAAMPPAVSSLRLEYVREPAVSAELDRELRELFSSCFPQPRTAFFRERRYANEMPLHRYLLRGPGGELLAHVAVHEKRILVAGASFTVGGIAEVCVHDSQRGLGRAKELLGHAHQGLRELGVPFALLFGEVPIYGSSGYQHLTAPIRIFEPATNSYKNEPSALALYKPLGARSWPDGPIDLDGPMF